MKAYAAFLILPVLLWLTEAAPSWAARRLIEPGATVSVPRITVPLGLRDLMAGEARGEIPPLNLAALMHPAALDYYVPPPPRTDRRPAADRFGLISVLMAPDRPSAVIDRAVVFEGSRIAGGYRVVEIAEDRVTLDGPGGREQLRLAASHAPSSVRHAAYQAGAPGPSSEELERQYRLLLERLDH